MTTVPLGRRKSDSMIQPALEILRQVPAAAAVVITAWLFLTAQAEQTRNMREQHREQLTAVLEALAQTTEAMSANTRALSRVELVLEQVAHESKVK